MLRKRENDKFITKTIDEESLPIPKENKR